MKQVLRAIAAARQDEITIDVSGLDEFDIDDFSNELDDAKKLLELGIGSETLKKQVFKKLALKYLCDARQEIKNQVAEEIEGLAARKSLSSQGQVRWSNAAFESRAGSTGAGRENRGGLWKASTFKRSCGRRFRSYASAEQAKSEPAYKAELRGRAEAAGTTGTAGERAGGREQAQPQGGRGSGAQLGDPQPSCSGWA